MTSRSPHDADQPAPRITVAQIDDAVSRFVIAAPNTLAAFALAELVARADIGDRLRVLVEHIAATLDDEHADRQAALEDAYGALVDLIGAPAPAPAVIVARDVKTDPARPFDRIAIEHPNGTVETLDVPERHTPCSINPEHGCLLGGHRYHATLRAAGYRLIEDNPDGSTIVERITDTERTTTP